MFQPQINLSDTKLKKDIVSSLPAYKNQGDDSNNQKILTIIARILNNAKNNLLSISDLMRLDKATGKNLTDWGKDFGIDRFDNDDDFLRFEIKWQNLKANTQLDMSSIKTLISVLVNVPLDQFDIVRTSNPHEITITNLPFDFSSGSHSEQKRQILIDSLQAVLPAETNLKAIEFSKQSGGTIYWTVFGNKSIYNESEVTNIGNI